MRDWGHLLVMKHIFFAIECDIAYFPGQLVPRLGRSRGSSGGSRATTGGRTAREELLFAGPRRLAELGSELDMP